MNAAAKAQTSQAAESLGKITDLIKNGQYRQAAETYGSFSKGNAKADFLLLEALPFRVQNHLASKIGSTAFSIYSLRKPTWTTDVVSAMSDPDKFDAFVKQMEAEVAASQPAPKQ